MRNDFKSIITIDFDDTIAEVSFPRIHGLKVDAKKYINKLYDEQHFIIINTCRTGLDLIKALEFLEEEGVKYHLANENHPSLIKVFNVDSRKISGDIHFDDKDIYFKQNPTQLNWKWFYYAVKSVTSKADFKSILHLVNN